MCAWSLFEPFYAQGYSITALRWKPMTKLVYAHLFTPDSFWPVWNVVCLRGLHATYFEERVYMYPILTEMMGHVSAHTEDDSDRGGQLLAWRQMLILFYARKPQSINRLIFLIRHRQRERQERIQRLELRDFDPLEHSFSTFLPEQSEAKQESIRPRHQCPSASIPFWCISSSKLFYFKQWSSSSSYGPRNKVIVYESDFHSNTFPESNLYFLYSFSFYF